MRADQRLGRLLGIAGLLAVTPGGAAAAFAAPIVIAAGMPHQSGRPLVDWPRGRPGQLTPADPAEHCNGGCPQPPPAPKPSCYSDVPPGGKPPGGKPCAGVPYQDQVR